MANLIITNDPAREAGEKISSLIREHVGDVVCILASGSASDIIEYIDLSKYCFHQDCAEAKENSSDEEYTKCQRNECRTIFIMGDEWVSGEAKINNYLQLQSRYPKHQVLSNTISTIPELGESAKTFSERIEKTFLEILIELNKPKIIFILEIGTDGHVAGILPMDEASFRKTYQDDRTYVSVHVDSLKIDSRASFTPSWILNNADEVIGYAVGSDKLEILKKLDSETKKLNERPAELFNLYKRVHIYTDQDIEE
ncbi:6-phosphogluconolactonase [Candidatus Nomurabacteria bacterium]|nr:6-phosphogluconolactonase [Candidatus Kaiserbacteria bacterium]MCB9810441.1 6-phosphogluconolactonase [Candidatus Nomurabacteria bacterium]MCB9818230.1 6-phosphogluconolactonase [Candidatus Nomurabacteria bacterium]